MCTFDTTWLCAGFKVAITLWFPSTLLREIFNLLSQHHMPILLYKRVNSIVFDCNVKIFNVFCAIQVRHYYYRLVRRMKKLLGPGFSLDAKNSKDTIAAMLRW